MTRWVCAAVLLSMIVASCGRVPGPPAGGSGPGSGTAEGWITLFDGGGLSGWSARPTSDPNESGDWTVEGGTLKCGGGAPGWIHTDEEFTNFRLVLEFQGADSVNSGVFLRSQREGQPHQTGYELNIWDYQPAGYLTGSLNEHLFAKASPGTIPEEWNTFDVTARADRFLVVLNGDTVLDGRDASHSRGVIGLQCQTNNPVAFRNIRILPLD